MAWAHLMNLTPPPLIFVVASVFTHRGPYNAARGRKRIITGMPQDPRFKESMILAFFVCQRLFPFFFFFLDISVLFRFVPFYFFDFRSVFFFFLGFFFASCLDTYKMI